MSGWTHEEAKRHTVVERLLERCSIYAQDQMPCPEQGDDLPPEDWCERCLAATQLIELGEAVARVESLAGELDRQRHVLRHRVRDALAGGKDAKPRALVVPWRRP